MRFIVIGCGRWGASLAGILIERHHDVAVVDVDAHAFERLGDAFRGERIVGSGLDREILIAAGIERASGLAAVTFSDEINVAVTRAAREAFRVPKVVARLYDPQKADIYRRLGIETISTVEWGSNRIADLLSYSSLDVSLSIGHGGVDIAEVEVPAVLAGRTVAELTIPGEARVIALSRDGQTFLPAEGAVLAPGDRVHLVLVPSSVGRLKRLLGID